MHTHSSQNNSCQRHGGGREQWRVLASNLINDPQDFHLGLKEGQDQAVAVFPDAKGWQGCLEPQGHLDIPCPGCSPAWPGPAQSHSAKPPWRLLRVGSWEENPATLFWSNTDFLGPQGCDSSLWPQFPSDQIITHWEQDFIHLVNHSVFSV